MWDGALLIAGVVLVALPALGLGVRGALQHQGYRPGDPDDRAPVVLMVTVRVLTLLLVLLLSGLVLVSCVGAWINDVELHGMVYVLFVLDLLLSALVLLTFGRSVRRPARRRANPARR